MLVSRILMGKKGMELLAVLFCSANDPLSKNSRLLSWYPIVLELVYPLHVKDTKNGPFLSCR
jgi:hypothetical protein